MVRKNGKKRAPVHPGEILRKDFIESMRLTQTGLARALHVPARRINEIVWGQRGITPVTALRLGRYFRMSPRFWLGLQMDYELDLAQDASGRRIEREVKPRATAR